MVKRKRPVWLHIVKPEVLATVCSWCGVNVPTVEQQEIHEGWHRAVGVVPLDAPTEER